MARSKIVSVAALRKEAEKYFKEGFCGIAAAFNLADCREWRFEPVVQKRATDLLTELMGIFKANELESISAVGAAKAAAKDEGFQRFLATATQMPRKARKRSEARPLAS